VTCFVYVLGCVHHGRALTYVGWSNDVARRLAQHNAGRGARTTRGRAWALLHTEAFATRGEAMSREWHLKRDRAFRKKLAEGMKVTGIDSSCHSGQSAERTDPESRRTEKDSGFARGASAPE
jgi:putative endonuclease